MKPHSKTMPDAECLNSLFRVASVSSEAPRCGARGAAGGGELESAGARVCACSDEARPRRLHTATPPIS